MSVTRARAVAAVYQARRKPLSEQRQELWDLLGDDIGLALGDAFDAGCYCATSGAEVPVAMPGVRYVAVEWRGDWRLHAPGGTPYIAETPEDAIRLAQMGYHSPEEWRDVSWRFMAIPIGWPMAPPMQSMARPRS